MQSQVQAQREAAQNRQQFYGANQGRPAIAATPRPFPAERGVATPARTTADLQRPGTQTQPGQMGPRQAILESHPGQTASQLQPGQTGRPMDNRTGTPGIGSPQQPPPPQSEVRRVPPRQPNPGWQQQQPQPPLARRSPCSRSRHSHAQSPRHTRNRRHGHRCHHNPRFGRSSRNSSHRDHNPSHNPSVRSHRWRCSLGHSRRCSPTHKHRRNRTLHPTPSGSARCGFAPSEARPVRVSQWCAHENRWTVSRIQKTVGDREGPMRRSILTTTILIAGGFVLGCNRTPQQTGASQPQAGATGAAATTGPNTAPPIQRPRRVQPPRRTRKTSLLLRGVCPPRTERDRGRSRPSSIATNLVIRLQDPAQSNTSPPAVPPTPDRSAQAAADARQSATTTNSNKNRRRPD